MPLSDNDEAVIRTWIGDDLTTEYLQGLYDGMAPNSSWDQVIIMALHRKIALASEAPESFTVPGLSLNWGWHQIDALNNTLTKFLQSGGTGLDEVNTMGSFVGHLVRVIPR